MQLTRERPRWHFVDKGQMSEVFLDGSYLRDNLHPNADFLRTVLEIYLNLHADHGKRLAPVQYPIVTMQDLNEWDSQDFKEKYRQWEKEYHHLKLKWLFYDLPHKDIHFRTLFPWPCWPDASAEKESNHLLDAPIRACNVNTYQTDLKTQTLRWRVAGCHPHNHSLH